MHDARNQVVNPSDVFSFSHVRNATRLEVARLGALRTVSSSEHGLKATVDEQIGSWEKTLSTESWKVAEQNFQSRIGIGLPMSNIYATCVVFILYTLYSLLISEQLQVLRGEVRTSLIGWLG